MEAIWGRVLAFLADMYRNVLQRKESVEDSQSAHDQRLFTELQAILPEDGSIAFVSRYHGEMHHRKQDVADLIMFLDRWNGPKCEFINPALEAKSRTLHDGITAFVEFLTLNTYPLRGNSEFYGVPVEWQENPVKDYAGTVSIAGQRAEVLTHAHAEFIREAKRQFYSGRSFSLRKHRSKVVLAVLVLVAAPFVYWAWESRGIDREFLKEHASSAYKSNAVRLREKGGGSTTLFEAMTREGEKKWGANYSHWLEDYDLLPHRGDFDAVGNSWKLSGRVRRGEGGERECELLWKLDFWDESRTWKTGLPALRVEVDVEVHDHSGFVIGRAATKQTFISSGIDPNVFGVRNSVAGSIWIPVVLMTKGVRVDYTFGKTFF